MHDKAVHGKCQWMGAHHGWGRLGRLGPSEGGWLVGWVKRQWCWEVRSAGHGVGADSISAPPPLTAVWRSAKRTVVWWSHRAFCHLTCHVVRAPHVTFHDANDEPGMGLLRQRSLEALSSEHIFSTTLLRLNNAYSFGNTVNYQVHQRADRSLAFRKNHCVPFAGVEYWLWSPVEDRSLLVICNGVLGDSHVRNLCRPWKDKWRLMKRPITQNLCWTC